MSQLIIKRIMKGFVLLLLVAACDSKSPYYEFWNICPSPCGDGCDIHILQTECTSNCAQPALTCIVGFYRNPLTHQCVQASECPTAKEYNYNCTKSHEVLKLPTPCDDRCNAIKLFCPHVPAESKPRCGCVRGYCRNKSGICVSKH